VTANPASTCEKIWRWCRPTEMKKQHKETQLFRHDAERNHPCSNRAIPLTNFDQLRGRQTLCVGFEPPVTAVLIVRYNGWKGFDTGCLGGKGAV